jgi:hypothetical protein
LKIKTTDILKKTRSQLVCSTFALSNSENGPQQLVFFNAKTIKGKGRSETNKGKTSKQSVKKYVQSFSKVVGILVDLGQQWIYANYYRHLHCPPLLQTFVLPSRYPFNPV